MSKNITVTDRDHKEFKHLAIDRGVSGLRLFNDMLNHWKKHNPIKREPEHEEKAS